MFVGWTCRVKVPSHPAAVFRSRTYHLQHNTTQQHNTVPLPAHRLNSAVPAHHRWYLSHHVAPSSLFLPPPTHHQPPTTNPPKNPHPRQARQARQARQSLPTPPSSTAPSPLQLPSCTVVPSDWPERGPDRPTRDDVIGGGSDVILGVGCMGTSWWGYGRD